MATATAPPPQAAAPPVLTQDSAAAQRLAQALAHNSVRLDAVSARLRSMIDGLLPFESRDVSNLCFALARGIDYALSNDHVPKTAHCLPSVIKQVYPHRKETSLQSAISVLMISTKNACKNGWFHGTDANELLSMANELCNNFCMEVSATESGNVLDTISKIMPRFYPELNFNRLIVSFEAKPGYDILMADFHIGRNLSQQERIRLFVVQTDNLETSSCIVSPPQVSFLVNGKGVEKRCNISLDSGPQFPTDITKMLKYGTNIIQAAGYFSGTCLIAVAFVAKVASLNAPTLKDYVQPNVVAVASDSEIIEGPSRITLNCPISFKRIKTPIKGHLCKHHQCFDYENFMAMNSRKPSWRCPCCNQPTSFVDLRIDQNMAKIIGDVGEDVVDVVVFADGSWKVGGEQNQSLDQQRSGAHAAEQDREIECHSNRSSSTLTDAVDLTMEDVNQSDNIIYEAEDRKPFQGAQAPPISQIISEPAHSNSTTLTTRANAYQLSDVWSRFLAVNSSSHVPVVPTRPDHHTNQRLVSMFPNVMTTPVVTDALQNTSQVRQPLENVRSQQNLLGNTIISTETGSPIPRNVIRNPIAIQALPVQTHAASSSQRLRTSYHAVHSNRLSAVSGDMDMLQASRTSEIPVMETRDNQNQWQFRGPTVQHIVGLPAPNLSGLRVPSDRERVGGLNAAEQIVGLAAPNLSGLRVPPDRERVGGLSSAEQIMGLAAPKLSGLRVASDRETVGGLCPAERVGGLSSAEQIVGLAAPNLPSLRVPLDRETVGGYRAQTHYTMSQPTIIVPQSSHGMSIQAQQPSRNALGSAAVSIANRHDAVLAANFAAAHASRLQEAVVNSQLSRTTASNSSQRTADAIRFSSSDYLRATGGVMPQVVRVDNSQETPGEPNWRPTGRMRGSLTGNAYSAALNQYLVPSSQPAATRVPVSTVASATNPTSVLVANNFRAIGTMAGQDSIRPNGGTQP